MNTKNQIAAMAALIASGLLLILWFALGFNYVDAPLDLIISVVWWGVVAVAILLVKKAEEERRCAVRTLFIGDKVLFNPEAGTVHLEEADALTVGAEVLTGLEYTFNMEELSGHFRLNMHSIVHSREFEDGGATWKGVVILLEAPDAAIPFENRYELERILVGEMLPLQSTAWTPAVRPMIPAV